AFLLASRMTGSLFLRKPLSRLIEIKKLRSNASDIIVRPVAVQDYLERFKRALGEEQNGADEIR
ncbi:hypothetical protein ACKFKF_35070, partial [Phormidesmis sp. 146-12]